MEAARVGEVVGVTVGGVVGRTDGLWDGAFVGGTVGTPVGESVGTWVAFGRCGQQSQLALPALVQHEEGQAPCRHITGSH